MEYREKKFSGWVHLVPTTDPCPHTISDGPWCVCSPDLIIEVGTIIHVPMESRLNRNTV